jgi:hypothetical protein
LCRPRRALLARTRIPAVRRAGTARRHAGHLRSGGGGSGGEAGQPHRDRDPGPGVAPQLADARFTNRLRNTAASANELVRKDHAILLRNAFVDTDSGAPLEIPAKLRAEGEAGAYVVQANGGITAKFRQAIEATGARIVSYIPNSSFLVLADADTAGR